MTMTEYHVGITARSNPLFTAVGPDGNIWFSENFVNTAQLSFPRNPVDGNLMHSDPNSTFVGGIGVLNLAQANQFTTITVAPMSPPLITNTSPPLTQQLLNGTAPGQSLPPINDPVSDTGFVSTLFAKLYGREPDTTGLNFWVNQLVSGKMTRAQVVTAFDNSTEGNIISIQLIYTRFLGRPADTAGLNFWLGFLNSGGLFSTAVETIASSPEFIQKNGGGNPAALVNAQYGVLLNRAADSAGLSFWVSQLNAGVSAFAVAHAIDQSVERSAGLVATEYGRFLSRSPESSALAFYVSVLQKNQTLASIDSLIMSSDEYFRLQIIGFSPF
jgi:hypothetical protein